MKLLMCRCVCELPVLQSALIIAQVDTQTGVTAARRAYVTFEVTITRSAYASSLSILSHGEVDLPSTSSVDDVLRRGGGVKPARGSGAPLEQLIGAFELVESDGGVKVTVVLQNRDDARARMVLLRVGPGIKPSMVGRCTTLEQQLLVRSMHDSQCIATFFT